MNEKSIRMITEEVTAILLKKNAEYGGASFDLGLNGNMVHLWDKIKRYRNLVENNDIKVHFETLNDTLYDIIGYSIIGLHILNDKSINDRIHGQNS